MALPIGISAATRFYDVYARQANIRINDISTIKTKGKARESPWCRYEHQAQCCAALALVIDYRTAVRLFHC